MELSNKMEKIFTCEICDQGFLTKWQQNSAHNSVIHGDVKIF